MELVKATQNHLKEFILLDKEFLAYHQALGIDKQYKMQKVKSLSKRYFEKEFKKRLAKRNKFFYFATFDNKIVGYIYGYIEKLPPLFRLQHIGYLDCIIVCGAYRKKNVSTFLKKEFFTWLRKKSVSLCQIHVAVKNTTTHKIYEHWGFKPDQYRLIKKL